MDIDGDGVDDLLIGAPNADLVIESLIGGAGKLYVAYGASRPPQLPPSDQIIDLTNTSVGGSGDFLKEEGGNRPTEFTLADIDGDGLDDFVLRAGETERWYRFTTLGDGKGGNFIRVTPGELDNFVAPTAPQSNTVTVGTPTPIGARVVARSTWDGAIGSMFVGDALSQTGRVTEWTMRAGGYTGNREITPLIFRQTADGRFEITGVGATRTIAGGAAGAFAFDLQSGSDATGAGYFFGWKDGSAFGDNGGVIAFDFGGDFNPVTGGSISHPVSWLGDWQGLGQNVYVGKSAAPVWTDVRAYSVTATVSTGGILEFDLGRFLDRVGDPSSIEIANLILDAPGAVAPIAAPTDVANLTPSGGLLYFTAKTGDTGVELWVTDGTSGGTRLVKDLNPDAADSLPINLTDVAGTLFFTANAKVGGTELWMTDGTADGTKMVATLNGVPVRFTALPGDAALVATGAVPPSGKLALPFEFTLEVLKADGTRVGVDISLPKSGLQGTADNDDPVDLKDDIAGLLDAALVAAGLPAGAITVATTLDQTTLVFSAPDADTTGIVEVIVREATTIGFGAAQTTPLDVSLVATNAAPADGKLGDDLTFTMKVETVGGTTRTLTINLQAEATANNGSVANLAADLNAAMAPVLATFGFGTNGVTASAGAGPASGKLVLTAHERNIARITFTGADALGITDTDESSRVVAITASDAAPATGQPVVNLPLEIEITRTNGTTALLSLTLTEAATADNGGAGDLAFDLQQVLDAALADAGFVAGDLVVDTDDDTGTRLTLTSAADAIRSFTVFGADALGFGTPEEPQQASVREGDRVFFTMATSALGTELWTSDGTESGTRAFDLRPGALSSGPADLIAVDGVLYFTALDPANPATRVVWRYDGTGSPVALPSAAFSSPSGLAAAGHALVFTALPAGGGADREVFLLDGTTFTKLSSVPGTNSKANGVAFLDGVVYFAAEDAAQGTAVTELGKVGNELWKATTGDSPATSVVANIGTPDVAPTTQTTIGVVGYQTIDLGLFTIQIPIFGPVTTTTPGSVTGSFPANLTVVGDDLYFTAIGATTGRELYRTGGLGAALVEDVVPGTTSSSPSQLTPVGSGASQKLFFATAQGQLWVSDGTAPGTKRIEKVTTAPDQLRAVGDLLFFRTGTGPAAKLWVSDGTEDGTRLLDQIIPPPLPVLVSVLKGEGDDKVTSADRQAPASFTTTAQLAGEPTPVDITEAVRNALKHGDTRITVRVENLTASKSFTLELAGGLRPGDTGLDVVPVVKGLLADLYTQSGELVARGRSIIDMRALEADGYYLRIYNPAGETPQDVSFTIAIKAPEQGNAHPETDRDRIFGEDGDDLIAGNRGADAAFGQSGRDRFIGEQFEVRDLDFGETITLPTSQEELSSEPLRPFFDAFIAIQDPQLRLAIAEALDFAVTRAWNGDPLVHVPRGSERTDLSLSNPVNWAERILASDLAEISVLDAAGLGVTTLKGLEFAINIETLNLAANDLLPTDIAQLQPRQFGAYNDPTKLPYDDIAVDGGVYADAVNFKAGLAQLRNLALDFNDRIDTFMTFLPPDLGGGEINALRQFPELRRLSFDGAMVGSAAFNEIAALSYVIPGGTRTLEFLSLDAYPRTGLRGEYYQLFGPLDSVTLFDNPFFGFVPKTLDRVDAQVNFGATTGSFAGTGLLDQFMVRWTGEIYIPDGGVTTFFVESDDGSRLFVDGVLVVNNDGLHGMSEASGSIQLTEGYHALETRVLRELGWRGGDPPLRHAERSEAHRADRRPHPDRRADAARRCLGARRAAGPQVPVAAQQRHPERAGSRAPRLPAGAATRREPGPQRRGPRRPAAGRRRRRRVRDERRLVLEHPPGGRRLRGRLRLPRRHRRVRAAEVEVRRPRAGDVRGLRDLDVGRLAQRRRPIRGPRLRQLRDRRRARPLPGRSRRGAAAFGRAARRSGDRHRHAERERRRGRRRVAVLRLRVHVHRRRIGPRTHPGRRRPGHPRRDDQGGRVAAALDRSRRRRVHRRRRDLRSLGQRRGRRAGRRRGRRRRRRRDGGAGRGHRRGRRAGRSRRVRRRRLLLRDGGRERGRRRSGRVRSGRGRG